MNAMPLAHMLLARLAVTSSDDKQHGDGERHVYVGIEAKRFTCSWTKHGELYTPKGESVLCPSGIVLFCLWYHGTYIMYILLVSIHVSLTSSCRTQVAALSE